MPQYFKIIGTGSYLPGQPVSAAEVERRAGLPDCWIEEHTQVTYRHECQPPESLLTMGRNAAMSALKDAAVSWKEIDLIIDGSTSRHQPIPCNAAVLQSVLGSDAEGIPCLDVHGTCLGFLLGLNVANALLASGQHNRILLVSSESPLAAANWADPESATILGDGAAAVVLERTDPMTPWGFRHQTFSQYRDDCEVLGGGHHLPGFKYRPEDDLLYRFRMNGPKLFKTALRELPDLVDCLIDAAGIQRTELLVIPHQASPRALEMIRRRLELTEDQFVNRASHVGNMASASVPWLIDTLRREGRLKSGTQILAIGTAAGYAQAGMIFRP